MIPLTRWPFWIPRRRRHLPESLWKSESFPNQTIFGSECSLFLDFVIFETLRRITKLFAKIHLRNAHILHVDHKFEEREEHTQRERENYGVCECGSSSNMFIFKDATSNLMTHQFIILRFLFRHFWSITEKQTLSGIELFEEIKRNLWLVG